MSDEVVILDGKKYYELSNVLLNYAKPSDYFRVFRKNGKLMSLYPEIYSLIGVQQNKQYHLEGDVYTHTMLVLDCAAQRRKNAQNPLGFMLAALCHDFGKAVCTSVSKDGSVHSLNHETAGLPIVEKFLRTFTADSVLIHYVLNMVKLHMRPMHCYDFHSRVKTTNRLFYESLVPADLILLSVCDNLGKIPADFEIEKFLNERYLKYLEMLNYPYVTNDDILKLGLTEDLTVLSKLNAYAVKLRLACVSKNAALQQIKSYYRNLC